MPADQKGKTVFLDTQNMLLRYVPRTESKEIESNSREIESNSRYNLRMFLFLDQLGVFVCGWLVCLFLDWLVGSAGLQAP